MTGEGPGTGVDKQAVAPGQAQARKDATGDGWASYRILICYISYAPGLLMDIHHPSKLVSNFISYAGTNR